MCTFALFILSVLGSDTSVEIPSVVPRFEVGEVRIRIGNPTFKNPFREVKVLGVFTTQSERLEVPGFCDSEDGSLFLIRFAPPRADTAWRCEIRVSLPSGRRVFLGRIWAARSENKGPVVPDPLHPRHFIYAGTGEHFYHLGYTAYHLLDAGKGDADVRRTIDYCARNGFNKIRFLLSGYPRDDDRRSPEQVPTDAVRKKDPWKLTNYGAPPGKCLPVPAWPGRPHKYDFTRFNIPFWRKCDRAVRYMLRKGIVATCILTIEKQNLPREYGSLTEAEESFYKYAAARLGAFSNVWWDLGNEHNEYRWPGGAKAVDDPRSRRWARLMGATLRTWSPYLRVISAHAYDVWIYDNDRWAAYVLTQQYGTPEEVNAWALKYGAITKPYVNEEYGYEGYRDKWEHGENAELVRRDHWAIALAGGYATYGDWTEGAPFYTGLAGNGRAAGLLKHLRAFFEEFPYWEFEPANHLLEGGFCLGKMGEVYLVYLPKGGTAKIKLPGRFGLKWFNPRTGQWRQGALVEGEAQLAAPDGNDWAAALQVKKP